MLKYFFGVVDRVSFKLKFFGKFFFNFGEFKWWVLLLIIKVFLGKYLSWDWKLFEIKVELVVIIEINFLLLEWML